MMAVGRAGTVAPRVVVVYQVVVPFAAAIGVLRWPGHPAAAANVRAPADDVRCSSARWAITSHEQSHLGAAIAPDGSGIGVVALHDGVLRLFVKRMDRLDTSY